MQQEQNQGAGGISAIRQNYHEECESAVNELINQQLTSSYFYLSMAFHFDRDDVALKGFHNHFKTMSDTKRNHAQMLLKYQNERGGRIVLRDIKCPPMEWNGGLNAMEDSLTAERASNQTYLDLYNLAESHGDEQFADYIEDNFLETQVEVIKNIGEHIANLKRVKDGLGEYMFDANTLSGGSA